MEQRRRENREKIANLVVKLVLTERETEQRPKSCRAGGFYRAKSGQSPRKAHKESKGESRSLSTTIYTTRTVN